MAIYFYSAREQPYGCFSNFSRHGLELDGLWWPTSEHYFQAQKFATTDRPWFRLIQRAKTSKDAAKMGRNRTHLLREDWEEIKDCIMHRAVLRKFEIHRQLCQLLLATGEEKIVENSPFDYYWGCGVDGSGKNKLGRILEAVRSQLKKSENS